MFVLKQPQGAVQLWGGPGGQVQDTDQHIVHLWITRGGIRQYIQVCINLIIIKCLLTYIFSHYNKINNYL
jgi:hypothetical protein